MSIIQASKLLDINYSSAKSLLQTERKTGTIKRKKEEKRIIRKLFKISRICKSKDHGCGKKVCILSKVKRLIIEILSKEKKLNKSNDKKMIQYNEETKVSSHNTMYKLVSNELTTSIQENNLNNNINNNTKNNNINEFPLMKNKIITFFKKFVIGDDIINKRKNYTYLSKFVVKHIDVIDFDNCSKIAQLIQNYNDNKINEYNPKGKIINEYLNDNKNNKTENFDRNLYNQIQEQFNTYNVIVQNIYQDNVIINSILSHMNVLTSSVEKLI